VAKGNLYEPEFVDKILEGDQDIAVGKGVKMTVKEFKAYANRANPRSK